MREFVRELTALVNKHGLDSYTNTPDWILAGYLYQCLQAYGTATTNVAECCGKPESESHTS